MIDSDIQEIKRDVKSLLKLTKEHTGAFEEVIKQQSSIIEKLDVITAIMMEPKGGAELAQALRALTDAVHKMSEKIEALTIHDR